MLLQVMLTPIFILQAQASNLNKEIAITRLNSVGDISPPCLIPLLQKITSRVHVLLEIISVTLAANFKINLAVKRSTPA
eukprot:7169187-Heterocapsa_arctica.AAC.1